MDSFAGPESAIDIDGQTVVQDAFEDAIFRVLGAWSAFYGEAQGDGVGDIGVGGLGPHLKWVATLQPGYLQPRDLQPRLVQPNGIPSNSSDGAPFGSDAPDHLVGALTLRVPLKMPFFGPSLAQIFSVHEDCRAELEGSMLCLDANRWYWKLRARARIPLPTSLRFEGFVIGKAVSTPEKGVTHAQSKPKDDSSDRSHQEITAVPSVNDKSSRQLPFSVLPQTIAALAEELQAVAPRASERGDVAVADCGIQFGN
jgi:hypothetical protein